MLADGAVGPGRDGHLAGRGELAPGHVLQVDVNGKARPVAHVLRTWPARRIETEQGEPRPGLSIRWHLDREAAEATIDLGDDARFWPSDEALARWRTLAHEGRAAVVYE